MKISAIRIYHASLDHDTDHALQRLQENSFGAPLRSLSRAVSDRVLGFNAGQIAGMVTKSISYSVFKFHFNGDFGI